MSRVQIVDREDQLIWYADPDWTHFQIKVERDHRAIREWLETMTTGQVVICGCGKIHQPNGIQDLTWKIFDSIQRKVYRVYFENSDDAMTFKLTWGGDL